MLITDRALLTLALGNFIAAVFAARTTAEWTARPTGGALVTDAFRLSVMATCTSRTVAGMQRYAT